LCGDTHYTIPHVVTKEKNSPTADNAGHKGDQNGYPVPRHKSDKHEFGT